MSEFFQGCGTIKTCELPYGEDGRSSGTAFVAFSKKSELDAAIALNGELWPGTERWLKIVEGAEKSDRKSFGGAYYTTLYTLYKLYIPYYTYYSTLYTLYHTIHTIPHYTYYTPLYT